MIAGKIEKKPRLHLRVREPHTHIPVLNAVMRPFTFLHAMA